MHKLQSIQIEKVIPTDTTIVERKEPVSKGNYDPAVIQHKLDSVNHILDQDKKNKLSFVDSTDIKVTHALSNAQLPDKISHQRVDSLTTRVSNVEQKGLAGVDSATLKITQTQKHYRDSLNALINTYQSKMQFTELTSKVDSLKAAGLPYQKYTGKLDSLSRLNSRAVGSLQKPMNEISQAQSKLTNVPTDKVNEKLNLLSKEAGGQGNLPGNLNLPSSNGLDKNVIPQDMNLPKTNLSIDPKLPAMNQPSVDMPDNPINKNLNTKLNMPQAATAVTKSADLTKLDEITKQTGELSTIENKVSGYSKDIKKVNTKNVEKTVEKEAVSNSAVSGELAMIQKQNLDKDALLKSYKNPAEYKKQTLARARTVVAQQLAIYEKELQQSVSKVSSYQNKLGTILSKTSDLPKKRDALRKLKTFEKLVPGVTAQVQVPGAWLVDVNPSLRYRLTSYWSIGVGWNERILFGKYTQSCNQTRVYGTRLFTEVIIFKGLSFRLDAEDMNTIVTPAKRIQDTNQRLWMWNYMAGIKKEFSFIAHVTGNVQFMYDIYSSNNGRLYPTRFNVRFGFEHVLKRRIKKH